METQPSLAIDQITDQFCHVRQSAARRGEQRSVVRYPLEVPVVFQWTERGQIRESSGRTRDVSVRGAFVLSGDCPPQGTRVAIKMNFPAVLSSRTARIRAEGFVLRVESGSAKTDTGFVVESNGPRLFTR